MATAHATIHEELHQRRASLQAKLQGRLSASELEALSRDLASLRGEVVVANRLVPEYEALRWGVLEKRLEAAGAAVDELETNPYAEDPIELRCLARAAEELGRAGRFDQAESHLEQLEEQLTFASLAASQKECDAVLEGIGAALPPLRSVA